MSGYYQKLGFNMGDFPESEKYYQEVISLPMYYGLSDESQNQIVDSLTNIISYSNCSHQ